ncbi:hypothetical protein MNV49_003896 [Pseudohyphozyma bogoriensis]|nr:hypothetical protein MNV49_003896 [Pseudohyphozyma bogoriensis]
MAGLPARLFPLPGIIDPKDPYPGAFTSPSRLFQLADEPYTPFSLPRLNSREEDDPIKDGLDSLKLAEANKEDLSPMKLEPEE